MALIGPDNQNEVRLQILNADYESFENDPLRSFHNGHTGGSHEQLLFVRNQNPSKYYTNIVLSPVVIGVYDDIVLFFLQFICICDVCEIGPDDILPCFVSI